MAFEQKLSLVPPLPPLPAASPASGLGWMLFPGILDVSLLGDLLHPYFRPSFPFPDILEAGRPSCHLCLLPFPSLPFLLLLFPSPAKLPSPLPSSPLPPLGFFSSSPPSMRFHLPVLADATSLSLALLPASSRPPSLPPVWCPALQTCLFPACPRRTAFRPCFSDQPSSAAVGSPMVVAGPGRQAG